MRKRRTAARPLIFLSYASEDIKFVKRFKNRLSRITGRTVEYFMAGDSIPPGVKWADYIEDHLDRADCVIVFFSHAAAASQWVLFETGYAWAKRKRVIPLGIHGCDFKQGVQPVSARQGFNIHAADDLNRVVEELGDILQRRFKSAFSPAEYARMVAGAPRHGTVIRAWRLKDREEIYSEGISLVTKCDYESHVRATVSVFDPDDARDKHFSSYLGAIARKCGAAARKRGRRFAYDVVFGFRRTAPGLIPENVFRALRHRIAILDRTHGTSKVRFYELDQEWALNMLLLNYEEAIIGFPENARRPELQHGVRLVGYDVVAPVVQWYKACVRDQAAPLDISLLRKGINLPRKRNAA